MKITKTKTGISISDALIRECDEYISKSKRISNRSELIETALKFYLGAKGIENKSEVLLPELADSIARASDEGITKISKGLFRYAVEVEMLIALLANEFNVSRYELEIIRRNAIRNCRRIRGKINLDDLILRNQRDGIDDYEEDDNGENS